MRVIEWIEFEQNKDGTHSIMCSICGGKLKSKEHAKSIYTREHFTYCPYCGVKQPQKIRLKIRMKFNRKENDMGDKFYKYAFYVLGALAILRFIIG